MTNRLGQQLGNYRLINLLGRGGFAEVYLGEHIHLGTQAAIKVLHTQVNTNEIEMFRKEARTIARPEHPTDAQRVLPQQQSGLRAFFIASLFREREDV